MLVVKVELHSAVTHKVTTLAVMTVDNIGGTSEIGNYRVRTWPENTKDNTRLPSQTGIVKGYSRLIGSVWLLVAQALKSVEYSS